MMQTMNLSPIFSTEYNRTHTYTQVQFGEITHTSRIDDTVTTAQLAEYLRGKALITETTPEVGGHLDHRPLLHTLPEELLLPAPDLITPESTIKQPPRIAYPILEADKKKAKEASKIQLTTQSDQHHTAAKRLSTTLLDMLKGNHTSKNVMDNRDRARELHLEEAKAIVKTNGDLNHKNMGIFLNSVAITPPNLGKKFLSRGKQREQNRVYQQQKALKQIASHLDDQEKLGVDQRAHTTFCDRVNNLRNQLSKGTTHHIIAKDLLLNLNKARDDSAYRQELHTRVKQELTLLNQISATLRTQHERETMNKLRTTFQKLLATNPKAAHRYINRKKNTGKETEEQMDTVQPHTAIKDPTTGHRKRGAIGSNVWG